MVRCIRVKRVHLDRVMGKIFFQIAKYVNFVKFLNDDFIPEKVSFQENV